MKFIILVPEAHGHVNPTLPLAAELTAHGHEVVYFLPEAFAAVARANGATLRAIPPLLEFPTDSSRSPFNLRQMAELTTEQQAAMTERIGRMQERMRAMLPELQGRIAAEAADCVIYDAYGFWLPDVARTIPGPKVAFFPTFAIPDGQVPRDTLAVAGRQFFPSAFLSLQTSLGFGSFFAEPFHAEDVNVVALPRAFQPNPDAFDDRYLFVGPSIRREGPIGDFPIEALADRRVALVSLGTAASDAAFFDACFDAFASSDWLVVAATGRTDPGTLRPLPDNVIARTHVPSARGSGAGPRLRHARRHELDDGGPVVRRTAGGRAAARRPAARRRAGGRPRPGSDPHAGRAERRGHQGGGRRGDRGPPGGRKRRPVPGRDAGGRRRPTGRGSD